LAETPREGARPAAATAATLKALVLTDLVDSTGLVRRLGDAGAAEVFGRHDRLARDLFAAFAGREIDKADGFLAVFDRPLDAVQFALAFHRALAALARELGLPLAARVGIHVGEVYLRANEPEDVARGAKPLEVEGLAKPMVARLVSLASGRQTLLTRSAFDLARRAAVGEQISDQEVQWLAHGSYRFQGLDEPAEIFEVGEVGAAPLSAPGDSGKARRLVAHGDEIALGWRPAAGQEVPQRRHWLLTQRLGEGGFGEVWLAAHAKTHEQRVFKFCYQAEQLRALRREVTVFRLLKDVLGSRDDIARILDWNFDEPPFFLESEYSEGGNLIDWSRELGGIAKVPLPERLELIAQVAEALAAAHSVGVLHKDVKPANVLISRDRTGAARARLTDFGVGLITDNRLLAARGITVFGLTELATPGGEFATGGTHLYMAPELLEGKPASIQADLYAVGVMLYQVVVGDLSRALAPGWQRDVEDELLREDIACFADGRPARRPASGLEIAERLRTLEQRRARRDAERRAEREAERARRRRRVFAVVGGVASVFLVVVSALAIQAIRARREAEQRRAQAEELVNFMVGDLYQRLDPVATREVQADIADKVLAYYDSLARERLAGSELYRRSQALLLIGQVRLAQSDLPAARTSFEEALELGRDLTGREGDNLEWLFGLSQCHYWVGNVLREQGSSDGALPHFQAYLEVAETLVAREPGNQRWQQEVAYAHGNLGFLLRDRGDLRGALEQLQAMLALQQGLVAASPGNLDTRHELARTFNIVGSILQELGELEQAFDHYRQEVEIKREVAARNPDNSNRQRSLALGHNYLGQALLALGRPQQALEEFRAAVAALTEPAARDPSNASLQRELAINRLRVVLGLARWGRQATADGTLRMAVATLHDLAARDATNVSLQSDLARAHHWAAETFEAHGQAAAAMEEAAVAVGMLEALARENPQDRGVQGRLGQALVVQGRLFASRGEETQARAAWSHGSDVLTPLAGVSQDFQLLDPLARTLLYLGRSSEAQPILRKLLTMGYREVTFVRLCQEKGLCSEPGPP
jgi:serine/threonine-protein kinase